MTIDGRKRSILATIGLLLLGVAGTTVAREIKMPTRGDAFTTARTLLITDGHIGYDCDLDTPDDELMCAIDMSALRWDEETQNWTRSKTQPNVTAPADFSDDPMWDMPIYSPVDGEVIACWRSMPDDDVDGDDVNCGDQVCMAGGNHLNILTEDGDLYFVGHLRQDTVPWELCPIAEDIILNTEPKTCELGGAWEGLRDGTRFDLRGIDPIPVRQGDFLGRIGTSGQGQGVHLHVHVKPHTLDAAGNPCEGRSQPLEFVESWWQPRQVGVEDSPLGWTRLEGERLPFAGDQLLLWPDPLGPRTDTVVLGEGDIPTIAMTSAGGVVAFRNGAGNLTAAAFEVNDAGDFGLGGHVSGPSIRQVAASAIAEKSPHVVLATIDGMGDLEIRPHHVTGGENDLFWPLASILLPGPTLDAGRAELVATTPSPQHDGVVVALRDDIGELRLRDYRARSVGLTLSLEQTGSGFWPALVDRLDIATVRSGRGRFEGACCFQGVVTAERNELSGNLVVRSWAFTPSGNMMFTDSAIATVTGVPLAVSDLEGTDVAVSVVGTDDREFVVTSALEAGSEELRVQTWEISSTGTLTQVEEEFGGFATRLASTKVGAQDALTGVRDSTGGLAAISWSVRPGGQEGGEVRRVGKRVTDEIGDVAIGGRPDRRVLVAALVDSEGDIRLLHYLTNYASAH